MVDFLNIFYIPVDSILPTTPTRPLTEIRERGKFTRATHNMHLKLNFEVLVE